MKKYLFIYEHLNIGGIETLIVRLANALAERGDDITLLLFADGELVHALNLKVKVFIIERSQAIYADKGIHNLIQDCEIIKSDVVMSFNPTSAIFAAKLSKSLVNVTFLTGVYHPRAYFYDQDNLFKRTINKVFFNTLKENQFFFMNKDVRKNHENYFHKFYSQVAILPIPLKLPETLNPKKVTDKEVLRICTIGRFTAFKKYNFYMTEVVDELLKIGHSIEFHIYGHGPLESEITSLIAKMKNPSKVKMMGKLDYNLLPSTFSKYDLFIGMGTSVLEASIYGLPAIVAIEGECRPKSYGFVHELRELNCGEVSNELELFNIKDLIQHYLTRSDIEKELISLKAQEFTKQFSMSAFLKKYDEVIEISESYSSSKINSIYVCYVFQVYLKKFKRNIRGFIELINKYIVSTNKKV